MLTGVAAALCATPVRFGALGALTAAQSTAQRLYATVTVTDNKVEAALALLRRKCIEADLPKELRKRAHYMNKSDRKFETQRASYNRAMGSIIRERVQWLEKRKLVKL